MKYISCYLALLLLVACSDEKTKAANVLIDNPPQENPSALNVPNGFAYKMDRDITFHLQVFDHNGNAGYNIGIRIYEPSSHQLSSNELSAPAIAPKQAIIYSGQTDEFGYFEETVILPMHLENIYVQASQLGIQNSVIIDVNGDSIYYQFK